MIQSDVYEGENRIQSTRGKDYLFVYSGTGRPFKISMGKISGNQVKGYWFDPREGTSTEIGVFNNSGIQEFIPPSNGLGREWILILDDLEKGYKEPVKNYIPSTK